MRIAHFSDLHLLDLTGAVPFRLFNKRLTGYLNLRLKRGHIHKPEPVRLGARSLRELGVDHVVVTGDVSNLALEKEFDLVRELFEKDMGFSADQISVVPGNHDMYTQGSARSRRFLTWFHPYASSDIEGVDEHHFPFVRLRGPLALIGLSTAVPRPPFIAAGIVGRRQLARLRDILVHPEVKSRTPVVLQHHPPINPKSLLDTAMKGLWDAKAQVEVMSDIAHGLVLHGHNHRRLRREITTRTGSIEVVGATSASLLDDDHHKVAGFNVYDFEETGRLAHISTHRFDAASKTFSQTPLAYS